MAIVLTYDAVEKAARDKIRIYSTTGLYHSVNNPTGFGGPNPATSDVTAVVATITLPDATTLAPSTDPALTYVVNIYSVGAFPNVTGTPAEILATQLGFATGEKLRDGMYFFSIKTTYTVSAVSHEDTYTFRRTFINENGCCVDAQFAGIEDLMGDCAPCRESLNKKLIIGMAYDGMILNNNCAKPYQSLDILKVAQPLCQESDCGCS